MTKAVFKKHFELLIEEYQKVLLINLAKKHKQIEHLLTTSLIKILNILKDSKEKSDVDLRAKLKHIMFDFHHETRGDNFKNLALFI